MGAIVLLFLTGVFEILFKVTVSKFKLSDIIKSHHNDGYNSKKAIGFLPIISKHFTCYIFFKFFDGFNQSCHPVSAWHWVPGHPA